jgi:hypothetical protein
MVWRTLSMWRASPAACWAAVRMCHTWTSRVGFLGSCRTACDVLQTTCARNAVMLANGLTMRRSCGVLHCQHIFGACCAAQLHTAACSLQDSAMRSRVKCMLGMECCVQTPSGRLTCCGAHAGLTAKTVHVAYHTAVVQRGHTMPCCSVMFLYGCHACETVLHWY